MRRVSKMLVVLLLAAVMGGWDVEVLLAAPAPVKGETAAIHAIEQAPDPSSVVEAYANGFALNRDDPALYAAYVKRMVDLGLPAIAYHQAQTLTSLQPRNGLGWGVVAYVDARRADMVSAVSAINLAGQFAPNSKFVQSTAGEILAWYDVEANKSQLPASARAGLARIRSLLEKDTAFTQAYDTAKEAYQAQATGTAPPAATAAPASPNQYASAVSATPYYVDYYYGWGPGWIEPAPWCWWEPLGSWYGFDFSPEFPVVVFNNHEFFEHHHFHQGEFFEQEHHFEGNEFAENHHGFFGHGWDNRAAWHRGQHGHTAFFGPPARPSPTVSRFAREDFFHQPTAIAGARFTGRYHGLGSPGAGSRGAELLEHPELGFDNNIAHERFGRGGVENTFPGPATAGPVPNGVAGGRFPGGFAGGGFHNEFVVPRFHSGFGDGEFHHGFAGEGRHGGFDNGFADHDLDRGFGGGEFHQGFAGEGRHGGFDNGFADHDLDRGFAGGESHHGFAGEGFHGGFHNGFADHDFDRGFAGGEFHHGFAGGGFHSPAAGRGFHGGFGGGGFHGGFHGGEGRRG